MPSVTVSDLITVLEIGPSGRRGFGMTCRKLVTMPALTAMPSRANRYVMRVFQWSLAPF